MPHLSATKNRGLVLPGTGPPVPLHHIAAGYGSACAKFNGNTLPLQLQKAPCTAPKHIFISSFCSTTQSFCRCCTPPVSQRFCPPSHDSFLSEKAQGLTVLLAAWFCSSCLSPSTVAIDLGAIVHHPPVRSRLRAACRR
jgi:hypothetical protein